MKEKVLQQSHWQTQHNRGNKISDLEDRLAEMTQIETQRNKESGKNRAPKSYEIVSNWSTIELGSTPGLGRSPGEGNGYPLQDSCLENFMGCIHGLTKNETRLSDFHFLSFLEPDILKSSHSS